MFDVSSPVAASVVVAFAGFAALRADVTTAVLTVASVCERFCREATNSRS
ncbi:hypothetical protein [Halosimplex pelagicum]|uniref:Uncharacterized protein n=1 Tax=Halosimplex pelagicum TaxID=869886 RepID=A0A7D5PCB8_9EURY|nr:hypothetical protein [Halosimplex pelagicum]QLH83085.1 hypothetical protein HZS54_16285 [Halosimplex pelagicum]